MLVCYNSRWIISSQVFSRLLCRMLSYLIHVSYISKDSLFGQENKDQAAYCHWSLYSFRHPVPCERFILFPGGKIQNPFFSIELCGPEVEIKPQRPWIKMCLIIRGSCDMPWERRLNNISDASYMQVDNKGKKFSQIWGPLGEEKNSHNEKGYFFFSIATDWLQWERFPNTERSAWHWPFSFDIGSCRSPLLSFFAWLNVSMKADPSCSLR